MNHLIRAGSVFLCVLLFLMRSPFPGACAAGTTQDATFDVEAESFDYGEDVTKIVIDMKEEVDPASITAATFTVAVKDYPTYNWQTKKVTNVESIVRKVTGVSVDGSYVTLELEYGFGITGASTLMYDGGAWRNIPIDIKYEVTQTAEFLRADGSKVAGGDKTYEQKRVYNLLVDQFDSYTDDSRISYALYEPEKEDGKQYPLIVWLHGAGEGGYNNKVQIRGNKVVGLIADDVQALFANGGTYVLAPQCPTGWMEDNDHNNRSDYLEEVIALIERTIGEENVDPEKVYIGGCSMGGYMTWNVILTRPDLFAAAFPVCPAYLPSVAELETVVNLPIWVVHSADDTTVKPAQFSRLTVEALKNLGGDIHYTEFEKTDYNGHWSWQYVFNNFYSEEYGETIMQWVAAHDRAQNAVAAAAISASPPSEAPSATPSVTPSAAPSEAPASDGAGAGYTGGVLLALLAAVVIVGTMMRVARKKSGTGK